MMVGSYHSLGVPPAGDNPEFAIVGVRGKCWILEN